MSDNALVVAIIIMIIVLMVMYVCWSGSYWIHNLDIMYDGYDAMNKDWGSDTNLSISLTKISIYLILSTGDEKTWS